MAISIINVKASWSGTDATTMNWSLSSLTTSRWLVFDIYTAQTSGYPEVPTLSDDGPSLTYIQEATITSNSVRRFTRFYAWNPSSTSFTLTTDGFASNQTSWMLHVQEINGADSVDPFVQTKTKSGTGTSGNITGSELAAYSHADNRFLGACNMDSWTGGSQVTEEHTELSDNYIGSGGSGRLSVQWSASTQDTDPTWTWTSSTGWRAIVSEVKADTGGAAYTPMDPFGMMGFFGA